MFYILFLLHVVSISFCAFMFVLLPTIPPILNVVAPLNESRSREFIYPSYYFVDEQRYYYPILVHMISVAVILTSVYIACDINLVHVVHHGCALLAISGWVYFGSYCADSAPFMLHRVVKKWALFIIDLFFELSTVGYAFSDEIPQ